MRHNVGILSLALALTFAIFGQAAFARQPNADKLSNNQLLSLIATAKTPAEHLRLAEYYSAKAKAYDAESKMHAAWAEAYKKNVATPGKFSTASVNHCEFFATSYKDMSTKMQELAQMHEQMAKNSDTK